MTVSRVSSSSRYAPVIGFSSAVRAGEWVTVAGATAIDGDGRVVGDGNPYAQAQEALRKIGVALQEAGTDLAHGVQTRTYLTHTDHWEQVGRAHGDVFAAHPRRRRWWLSPVCSITACSSRSKPSPTPVPDRPAATVCGRGWAAVRHRSPRCRGKLAARTCRPVRCAPRGWTVGDR